MYFKGQANQWVGFSQIAAADGSPVTGASPVVVLAQDGGVQTVGLGIIRDLGNGQYWYGPTADEMNCDSLTVSMFSPLTLEVEKTLLPFDSAHPPPSLVGPPGPPGPTGPTGPTGTTNLVIGSTVSGSPVAGGVLWTSNATPATVAQSPAGNFQFDPDGTYGPFATSLTLYIGDFATSSTGGLIGLFDAGLGGGCPLQVFNGIWFFGGLNSGTGGGGNFGGPVEIDGPLTADTGGAGSTFGGSLLIANGLTVSAGGLALLLGNLALTAGDVSLNSGNVLVPAGDVTSGGTVQGQFITIPSSSSGSLTTGVNTSMGLFGATAVPQQSNAGVTVGFAQGTVTLLTAVQSDSTFTGDNGTRAYTVGDIVNCLKAYGLFKP